MGADLAEERKKGFKKKSARGVHLCLIDYQTIFCAAHKNILPSTHVTSQVSFLSLIYSLTL